MTEQQLRAYVIQLDAEVDYYFKQGLIQIGNLVSWLVSAGIVITVGWLAAWLVVMIVTLFINLLPFILILLALGGTKCCC